MKLWILSPLPLYNIIKHICKFRCLIDSRALKKCDIFRSVGISTGGFLITGLSVEVLQVFLHSFRVKSFLLYTWGLFVCLVKVCRFIIFLMIEKIILYESTSPTETILCFFRTKFRNCSAWFKTSADTGIFNFNCTTEKLPSFLFIVSFYPKTETAYFSQKNWKKPIEWFEEPFSY